MLRLLPVSFVVLACFGLLSPARAGAVSLVLSRTVYQGTASTVTIGQALPGGGTAVANGSFPDVFKNETPDPSFGVTSPIYLDRLSPTGGLLRTIAVSPTLLTTSFSSKSELGLSLSKDGSAVTFMGYQSPINALDVSNSNTAYYTDPSNPVASSNARAVGALNLATGTVSATYVNAYSGNNGRGAVLADGNYYLVGNAGNSTVKNSDPSAGGIFSHLSDNTGVQMIGAGGSGNTTVVGHTYGSFGNVNGYQHGFQGAPTDKTGKVDNFRGITLFNDTLYVTKGSGSNGTNSVFQVGPGGVLPTAANASSLVFSVLSGFPTTGTATHPFGLWFGDATTLFVADEGDGSHTGGASAGLGEYRLVSGSWTKVATFAKGLTDQPTYTQGLGWSIYTDGLRNLTGVKNADGSFQLWATTATTASLTDHDLGADPNELVTITIGAGAPDPAHTPFTVLQTAAAGERLGGVVAVPEPQTYALMLGGLGVLALSRRRHRAMAS